MPLPRPTLSRRAFLGQLSASAALACFARQRLLAADAPPPKRQLGVALVGLGHYARWQLGPALRETKWCRLAAVVSGTPAKLTAWARDHSLPPSALYNYETFDRIADHPDVDIVYIVTPPGTHRDFVLRAARAGKHVICEKPMEISAPRCAEMIAACRAARVQLSIGYRLHFDPYHREFMRLAREEDFGPFRRIRGDWAFTIRQHAWRLEKPLAGGGPLPDIGIYLNQAALMAKNGQLPVAVTATELPKKNPDLFKEVEESIRWKLEFADGAVADFYTSYNDNRDDFRADADRGWIHFQRQGFAYDGCKAATSRGVLDYRPYINQQAVQMDDFAQCVLTGRPTIVPGEMGHRDLLIQDAIYASAASGQRVTLAPAGPAK